MDKRPIAKARLLIEMAHRLLVEERNDFDAPARGGREMTDKGYRASCVLSDAVEYNQTTLEELDGLL